MERFRVPRREVEVVVTLADGSQRRGVVFVPLGRPDSTGGTLLDRLNDEERFLAFRGATVMVLNKAGVISVESTAAEPAPDEAIEPLEVHTVRLGLSNGATVAGIVRYAMPAERGRLLDWLNAAPLFLRVALADGGAVCVNREFIVTVADSGGEETGEGAPS